MAIRICDFETTTDPDDCRVWAWGTCELTNPEYVQYGNSIDSFMDFMKENSGDTLYFHNLSFDGEFIIYDLLTHEFNHIIDRHDSATKTFTTLISDKNMFYQMTIYFEKRKKNVSKVTIKDSLKILPMSVERIAKAFKLPLSKLEIDYDEYREPGHELTEHEKSYIASDIKIIAYAIQALFAQDLTKLTVGSNALADYKKLAGKRFDKNFPIPDYDKDIRQSYKGGFTWLKPSMSEKLVGCGIVLDVNSLYPYVMYSRYLPFGEPIFFEGKYVQDDKYPLYITQITCQFELKPDHIPTIPGKVSSSFVQREYISSSNKEFVTMTLTSVDLKLFFDHYYVYNIYYHSGWKFRASNKLFKSYVQKWIDVKNKATIDGNGALREIAKLMLNSLYGKFALNPNVQSRAPYLDDSGVVRYKLLPAETRNPIYIPVGTFITAYAREITIRAGQQVYDRFVYADTDSLHLTGYELPAGLKIDKVELGAWKHEFTFTEAKYLHSKCYAEYGHEKEGEQDEMKVTIAGMVEKGRKNVTFDNFYTGSVIDQGKMDKKHVKGGIILKRDVYTIRKR